METTTTIKLETDYLVIGGGAMAIAFVDEMLNGSSNYGGHDTDEFIIVDRHAKPGGHWNDAYEFVTLHQPSAFYGVNSKHLGDGGSDLVSRAQILAYYEIVLKNFEASGRVNFFSLCEYTSGGSCFRSLVDSNLQYEVMVRKKIVNATYMDVKVPSITKPRYEIGPDVNLLPVNGLSRVCAPWEKYVILGSGKTGIDAVLFLLNHGIDPKQIIWIMPNDAWLLNRDNIQPSIIGSLDVKYKAIMARLA